MSTRLVASIASMLFIFGAVIQIWTFQLGLTLMLLGLSGAFITTLLLLRSMQRRLMKHDRLFDQLHRLSIQSKAETARYGSSLMRRADKILEEFGNKAAVTPKPSIGALPISQKPQSNSSQKQTNPSTSATDRQMPDTTLVPTNHSIGARNEMEVSEKIQKEPSPRDLEESVSHMWNVLGEITRPDSILRNNMHKVGDFSVRGQQLARQIADSAILLNKLPAVPPRSLGRLLTPRPNRILYCVHATPEFHSNGYAIRTRGVAEGLTANGKAVRVVGRPGYPWDVRGVEHPAYERTVETVNDIEYVHLPSPGVGTLPKSQYIQVAADALVREALAFRPSVIHAASNSQTALIALIAARRLGIPFVYEVRGLWEVTYAATHAGWDSTERYALDEAMENLVIGEADSLVTITRQLGAELENRGAEPEQISIVPNSVNTKHITPLLQDPSYELVPGTDGLPLVGFAGSLVEYEGLDLLIEAIGILQTQGIKCHVVIAGSGAYEETLKRQVKSAGLNDFVHFVGRLPHNEVRRMLASLDVVVCPRRSNVVTELVSPIKPLEAFAAGRVVLMSNVEPQLDLSSNGTIAPVFEADDPNALASELRELLADEELRRDYERRARLWVGDHRTWSEVCKEFLAAYSSAERKLGTPLEQGHGIRNLAELNIALVDSDPNVFNISAACNTIDIKSDESALRTLLETQKVDALILGPTHSSNYSLRHYASIARAAIELNVKTIFISTEESHLQKLNTELFGLIDHYAVVTNSPSALGENIDSKYGTSTSTVLDVVDPHEISPLRAAQSRLGPAVLEDSVPTAPVMDIARAHGLVILAKTETQLGLPSRFDTALRRFESSNDLLSNVAVSTAVLRDSSANGDRTSAILSSLGCTEILVDNDTDLDALDSILDEQTAHPHDWAAASWASVRRQHRTGTVTRAVADLIRAAGVPIAHDPLPTYALIADAETQNEILKLVSQTVPPAAIVIQSGLSLEGPLNEKLLAHGIRLETKFPDWVDFIGNIIPVDEPTFYEDILISTRFVDCNQVRVSVIDETAPRLASLTNVDSQHGTIVLERTTQSTLIDNDVAIVVHRLLPETGSQEGSTAIETHAKSSSKTPFLARQKTVLIAGHDLKFSGGIENSLRSNGCEVLVDKWEFHNTHDEQRSFELLNKADVILCEWGLGNAVWFSHHKSAEQRLVIRVHSQEIRTHHLRKIKHDNVDMYIFVNEVVRDNAVLFHGVPSDKTCIVPNYVDTERLSKPKKECAPKTVGFVGSVPKSKRLDLAVDIFERVLSFDSEYRMVIKGKTPFEYPWMKNRPDELAWYQNIFDRIERINQIYPYAIEFAGHSDDMPDWYTQIGTVLSTSDFESFHYTIGDGVASGAKPVVLYWPGAELIYPRNWIFPTVNDAADAIVHAELDLSGPRYIRSNYGIMNVTESIIHILFPEDSTEPITPTVEEAMNNE